MPSRKTEMIVKSNRLIEASYRLDLIEQRLILAAIVEARESQKGVGDGALTIEAKRFGALFPDMEKGSIYHQLKAARKRLFNRYVVIRDTHPETGLPRVNEVRWISSASYIDGAGMIQIRFSPEIAPYITRLETEYTAYRLEKIGHMTSVHAVRLYELLAQYLNAGKREIELAWLKQTLLLEEDYSRLYDFKRWVIDAAVEQINQHSDIQVSYTQRKTGRTVTHLIFDIRGRPEPKVAAPKKVKQPVIDEAYIKQHARPGESFYQANQRLLEEAGQGRLVA